MKLRPYQQELVDKIHAAWTTGAQNVLAVQATRTGKTVIFARIMADTSEPSVAIAHRAELIAQTSLALARCGVSHRIVAPDDKIKWIITRHIKELGRHYYDPRSPRAVASVDTLSRRTKKLAPWIASIRLWVVDEAHHITGTNKWAKAVALFPQARGLGVTATPCRADGQGLGRHTGGVFDSMVVGLQARDAIAEGWLLDHTIYAPLSDFHRPTEIGSTGDFTQAVTHDAVRKSRIVGDIVPHYLRLAAGKKDVVFAPDIEIGTEIAEQFNAANIPARIVSSKTPDSERTQALKDFDTGELRVLVNVDLFGEGTDLPDLDVVQLARPTESFPLFAQQTARASTPSIGGPLPENREARLMAIARSDKPKAIIIDHVGNVARHATAVHLGDRTVIDLAYGEWSLEARERAARGAPGDGIPLQTCVNPECMQVYERIYPACPYCGHQPVPANRSAPEFVDGDLAELEPSALAVLRQAVVKVDQPVEEYRAELIAKHCPTLGVKRHVKRHAARQEAQTALRDVMAHWAGEQRAQGRSQAEMERRFWYAFGVDALSAQALSEKEAQELAVKILSYKE